MGTIKIRLGIFFLLFSSSMIAQEKPTEAGIEAAIENAVNPVAFVTKLQMQPNFTWKDDKARQLNLTTRILQPSATIGLPFIKSMDPSKVYTIYRLEIPIIGQTYPKQPALDATGVVDLSIVDVVSFKKSWGMFGAGPGLIIPTYNPSTISGGKWCAGLVGVAINNKTKGFLWGASVQQFYSFAGSSSKPTRNFMLFQPILNKILGGGYFISCSPSMLFDWENDTYSIPMLFSFGKAFAKNLSAFFGPQYMLSGPGKGDFSLQFQINAMFPPSKNNR
jgi:hypothetical protein